MFGLPIRLSILRGRNFKFGHYSQNVQPNSLIPTMLTGTIDFDHFISLSVTLTLAVGQNVSTNLSASFSYKLFYLTRMKFNMVMNQFKLNILQLLVSEINLTKENNCCFTHCIKKLSRWHAFGHL